jgi:putative glutamine amidotransferase
VSPGARPRVGVTIAFDQRRAGFFTLRREYLRSLEAAGAVALVLAPGRPADAPRLLDAVQGLLLTGGSDVDPSLYGEAPHPRLGPLFRDRDDFELALCRVALDRDLPILGICRGHQVLNVATGGTLVQDIPSEVSGGEVHDSERERWQRSHLVRILPGTRLRELLGRDCVSVNSFHHQAVKTLGRGLRVSAVSSEGSVVEGIELETARFALGVQWHPEAFWDQADGFGGLFAGLVREGAGL